jgi:GntR family transcriptional regulator
MAASFQLDPRDPLPLYAQLERAIKLEIASGKLPLGRQLPTVRQMAVELKINANTVAKVYAELEAQGVLSTRRGVGTFVQAPPAVKASGGQRTEELRALAQRFLAEAAGRGFTPDELLLQMQRFAANSQENPHGRQNP